MCYHTHYIFLACGHSVSSLHPIDPSPPCPNQPQHPPPANNPPASQRPFSFDPSVVASPTSPLPEPFTAHAPWRLEGPFSTPESASATAIADENENESRNADPDISNKVIPTIATLLDSPEKEHEAKPDTDSAQGGRGPRPGHCGQILIHPYHSYKIEGPCLHCRRRRDTLVASFEVHAIRETVYREFVLGPTSSGRPQKRFRALDSHPEEDAEFGLEGGTQCGLKALPLPMPMSGLGRSVHFPTGRGVEQQQQQQTPWRLTLPPAEIPRTGWGLAGMRDGEWI